VLQFGVILFTEIYLFDCELKFMKWIPTETVVQWYSGDSDSD